MSTWKLYFVAFVVAFAVISAQSEPVRPGQAAHIVSLRTGGRHFCSASIMTRRHIITAGRCLVGRRPDQIIAFAGTTTTRTGRPYAIERVNIHPRFKDRSANFDVGILRIAQEFHYDRYVRSVSLSIVMPNPNDELFTVGWGLSENSAGRRLPTARGHSQLQSQLVGSINLQRCQSMHRGLVPLLQRNTICTLELPPKRGSCGGDTGSPLMRGRTLAGIQLWRNDCTGRTPTVFVHAHSHFEWFIQMIEQR